MLPSPPNSPIRVVIVDSSPLCSKLLERALMTADVAFEIAGCAANGRAGLALIERARPDVICCSNNLALLSGAELVAQTMSRCARPILVTQTRDAGAKTGGNASAETMAMLAAGAIDWTWKPQDGPRVAQQIEEFTHKLARAARVSVFTRHRKASDNGASSGASIEASSVLAQSKPALADAKSVELALANSAAVTAPARSKAVCADRAPELIAIGASTGGPPVLLQLLRALDPARTPPTLCVQHIAHGFLDEMLDWLRAQCRVEIAVAQGGEIARAGTVYFPAEDHHLEISSGGRLSLSDAPPLGGHRPAVNATFDSVARGYGPRALAILLTGMGADGATGLQQIQARGGATWAQTPDSCVVAGMPGRAIELGAANRVLSPTAMVERLEKL